MTNRRLRAACVLLSVALAFSILTAAAPLGAAASGPDFNGLNDLGGRVEFLRNPNRGFYHMCRAVLDSEPGSGDSYESMADGHCREYPGDTLVLLEVNLAEYRARGIDDTGIENLNKLLSAWEGRDISLIIRFLYDWDGDGLSAEPDELDTVLGHMARVGPALQSHEDLIFCLQGLFVGSWGEMHGTKFGVDFTELAGALDDATGNRIFLSVRTPAQLREILKSCPELKSRLGLFNDGMLGSETDLGTYDMADQGAERRTRAQELAFQENTCLSVPNGGEAVIDNPYNDFENAVADMSRMHVAYLNNAYDPEVLDKWAGTDLSGYGFGGLSGLDYIERRLGYRLRLESSGRLDDGSVYFKFRNDGFGAVLFPCEARLTSGSGVESRVLDLSGLYGERACVVTFNPVPGDYELELFDSKTGMPVSFV